MIASQFPSNRSLRYGFQYEKDYLMSLSMTQQLYMPIIGSLTFHPILFYLLIFENRSMLSQIRFGYLFTYLAFVLDEWMFCLAFRMYPLAPYSALYCEGPLCRSGWNRQWLLAVFAFPIIIENTAFDSLIVMLHQMFMPVGNKMKLSKCTRVILFTLHSSLMVANIIAWGVYSRESDNSEQLKKEVELEWLSRRGGTIFMFGPPGESHYFDRTLILYYCTQCIVGPSMIFLSIDATKRVKMANPQPFSSGTQAATRRMVQVFVAQLAVACLNHFMPLLSMFCFMVIDGSWIPDFILAFPLRFMAVTFFNTKSYVFGVFLLFKNPTFRKILINKSKRLIGREVVETKVRSTIEITKTTGKG